MLYQILTSNANKGNWSKALEALDQMRAESYPKALLTGAEEWIHHCQSDYLLQGDIGNTQKYHQNDLEISDHDRYELETFGMAILGPPLALFYKRMIERLRLQEQTDKIYFLAREGYFLKQGFEVLGKELGAMATCEYLLISRVLLFRCLMGNSEVAPLICHHEYTGTLETFLTRRCGLSVKEITFLSLPQTDFPEGLDTPISLPQDNKIIEDLLLKNGEELHALTDATRSCYCQYLEEKGVFRDPALNIIDIGYSGTIQKALGALVGRQINGHYLVTTPSAKNTTTNKFTGYLFNRKAWGSGSTLLDKSLYLESLLTSPVGSAINVHKKGDNFVFEHGRITKAQINFRILEVVFEGCIKYCFQVFKHGGISSPHQVDQIYTLQTSFPGQFPPMIREILEVEDEFSGKGIINAVNLYPL